jgi:hypothetical protein
MGESDGRYACSYRGCVGKRAGAAKGWFIGPAQGWGGNQDKKVRKGSIWGPSVDRGRRT